METKQAELFKILGVDSRIRIIELLKLRGPLGVNKMSKSLGITPSAVSQHLKILKHAGLVRNERKGYWLSLIHISEPTRHTSQSRIPSCA